jgi:hypothetical protein
VREQFDRFAEELAASSRLPVLDGAPVSAWVLGRVAALSGERFPFSYGQIYGSDGDDFWIKCLAFSVDGTVRPVGAVAIRGSRTDVMLWVEAAAPHAPAAVKEAFTTVLLADAAALKRAVVTVVYTSVEDPKHGLRIPYTIGWDGRQFVLRDAPEHAIDPEEVE